MADKRILIVEDEPIIAMDLQSRLEGLGYTVAGTAATGREAIQKAAQLQPDLVTMDVRLEGEMDGFETAQFLRVQLHLPVIFITAHADAVTFRRARDTAPYGYVRKPFDDYELWTMIEVALQRRDMERQLEESELRFRSLFETMKPGVVYQDATGRITAANPAAQAILGLTLDEMQGRTSNHPEWRTIREDGSPLPAEAHPAMVALRTGREVKKVILGVWHAETQKHRWLLVNAVPRFRPGDTRPSEVFTTFEDITEMRRAYQDLHRRNTELRVRSEELDAFAHTVAHDLKNPLGLVIGYAHYLDEEFEAVPPALVHQKIHIILRHARKIDTIIDELLLLASVRSKEVRLEWLDMGALVAEALRRVEPMLEELSMAEDAPGTPPVEIIAPDGWPRARGHGPWVEQIWVNYISNAIKYGAPPPERGEPQRIQLGADVLENGFVRFWLRDNGRGLSPEECARLFRPFTRLQQASVQGYGLGLSIVQRMVERLGGEVAVESSGIPGEGSLFSFTLPA